MTKKLSPRKAQDTKPKKFKEEQIYIKNGFVVIEEYGFDGSVALFHKRTFEAMWWGYNKEQEIKS